MNVYSLAEHEDMVVESEPCHVKVSHMKTMNNILNNYFHVRDDEKKIRRSENMKMPSSLRKAAGKLL